MKETRIKINSIIENQLPEFIRVEFPLVSEFLSQYYLSLESQGGVSDILQNIDQYIKLEELTNLTESTVLTSDVTFFDTTINVSSTVGFPESYGLILIDSEIITYTSKTSTTFEGCVRGFSGVTSHDVKDQLIFSGSEAEEHFTVVDDIPTTVSNLSILFLKQFLVKVKKQITPGFEDRELYSELNENLFIKQSIDFYTSKGTDNSFKILFGALYGKNVEIIRPRDYLIQPSDADYRITKDLVVKSLEGDITSLVNRTVYQVQSETKRAEGTVTKVERIIRGSEDYYILSLDYGYQRDISFDGTVFGEFDIHPSTKIITNITDLDPSIPGFTTSTSSIDVDSTAGFPNSGELVVNTPSGDLIISYKEKTLNQFLDCSGFNQPISAGTKIRLNAYAYGENENETVKFIITGVLSDLNLDKNYYQNKGFPIKIKSLGSDIKDYKANNWFFNHSVRYEVKSLSKLNNDKYELVFYDDHSFIVGDTLTLISSAGFTSVATVDLFNNSKSITIKNINRQLSESETYRVVKNLSRVNSLNYQDLNNYTSNVQNVYVDGESLYIASPSLPTYLDQALTIKDKSVTFSGTFSGTEIQIGNHSFYTGDRVYYRPGQSSNTLGISSDFYFVKRINDTTISLARSRSDISAVPPRFVSVSGNVTDDKIELSDFVDQTTLEFKKVKPQKIIRKLENPTNNPFKISTDPGPIGILINGVEILNYKSRDSIFYGSIEDIDVLSGGENYDVINPPTLEIIDSVGSGVTAYCSVTGNLKRIDIIDGGFDYLEDPKIIITGGNGKEADARANLISFDYSVYFNSQSQSNVNISSDTITFDQYHRFRDNESVIYDPDGQVAVGGLSTNSQYFVSVQNGYTIKLHNSFDESVLGINTISLTSIGVGNHKFKSTVKKKKIGSISVQNSGFNYTNNKIVAKPEDISIASDIVSIKNHGYSNGEVVKYSYTGSPITGLSTELSYYVTKIDENKFKLSKVGLGTTSQDFFYKTKQYINLQSSGNGLHIFNYEPISINVKGNIGISTLAGQDFSAKLQPIFRGSIKSVFVQDGGSSYGSEEILNYSKQPNLELKSGSGAQITPIITDGRIVNVIVNSSGTNYNSPPDLIVNGSGIGAVLTPVISNGLLIEVKIVSGGIGYSQRGTTIDVISAGSSGKLNAKIKSWTVNLFERLLNSKQITDDDGIPTVGLNEYGIQYTHLYSPRKLRSSVFGSRFKDGELIFQADIISDTENDSKLRAHSPIIGWAYDGNPIYGPHGYSSINGSGSIRPMTSGYQLIRSENRLNGPSKSIYPIGFFVEDYEYTGNGDLDEHNGRFCITPEYPNGVYAYFTTINNGPVESDPNSPFRNYKKPLFPYFVGKTYKSNPIEFNFSKTSNQDNIDINKQNWLRNTTPYKLDNKDSGYDYIFNPNEIRNQTSVVKAVSSGEINSIGIITGGNNYRVGDKIVFEPQTLDSVSPSAIVSQVKGKSITSVSSTSITLSSIEIFKPNDGNYIAISSSPYNLKTFDLVNFSSNSEYTNSSRIGINSNTLTLTSGIGSAQYTGIVTYFNVSGNLSQIFENDIYKIDSEQIKVLNVDTASSRIRVIRNQNGTSGVVTYSSGQTLFEIPRVLSLNIGKVQGTYELNKRNREYYFDPRETIGIGTTSGVGINSTVRFSNPGVGLTQITIPTRSLYIFNHGLSNGDELTYSSNGGTRISVSTNGTSSFQLQENATVYAVTLSEDTIGISTLRVGLGSQGNYVGLGSTAAGLLYFNNVGSGNTHSFKTNYSKILVGEITKNESTVSTSSTHGLSLYDTVYLNVTSGLSTTIVVSYNDANRRYGINPRSFTSSDVDVTKNTIRIENHNLLSGQKVIYTSASPSGGLEAEKMYHVVVVDSNNIKLSDAYYLTTIKDNNIINISSASSGTLLPVNPPIELTKNSSIIFDISSSSLRFTSRFIQYPAFQLNFYTDPYFTNRFDFSQSNLIEVIREGVAGESGSKVTLRRNGTTPEILYYKLDPINLSLSPSNKKEIIVDDDVSNFSQISLKESVYSGLQSVVVVSPTSFTFTTKTRPESLYYDNTNSTLEYYTNSSNAYGEIYDVKITSPGKRLKSLPRIVSVNSGIGSGSILESRSDNIGSIIKTKLEDIGFDYSSDLTIKPVVKIVDVLKVSPQTSLKSVGVSSAGKGYFIAPDLIVLDGLTNEIITDIDLKYDLDNKKVDILKNTKGINNIIPKIIPINNSNGISISDIVYNSSTKDVTVTLGSSFSNASDFPFGVGDRVIIENVSVGVGSTGKGFNSENYDYNLFTLTAVNSALGGVGAAVTFNLSNLLSDGEVPGNFDIINSAGKIISEKDFPIFDITLEKNNFFAGENVNSQSAKGIVAEWDSNSEYLKVSTTGKYLVGDIIVGESSKSRATIISILEGFGQYNVSSGSIVENGWEKETGFTNNQLQRIHDSDYYQYFSYSLKSEIPFETWNDPVSSLNHTVGFKKFSDLVIESRPTQIGIGSTDQNEGDFSAIADLSSFIDLNCINDFDLVSENNLTIDNKIKSDQIIFNSRLLQDYIESIGNRVLSLDDISDQFNDKERPTQYSIVDTFELGADDFRSIKYLTYVRDKRYTSERQVSLVTLIHDGIYGYLNQYGAVDTNYDMGSFDFLTIGSEGNLVFYPTKSSVNNFDISLISFDIKDNISSIGSTNIGGVVFVGSATTSISSGSSSPVTVVGIASTYRSSKVLVQIGATTSDYFEYDEITLIHDGTDIIIQDYGQLTTSEFQSYSSSGIGTYHAYYSGSDINIDLIPYTTTDVQYNVNSVRISIGNSSSSGIGTQTFDTSSIQSNYVAIASSTSPGITTISSYSSNYQGAYYIVSIEDLTNNQYEVLEVVSANDSSEVYYSEFGIIQTNSSIGSIGATISSTTQKVDLTFTPNSNTEVQVRVYQNAIGVCTSVITDKTIDFTNSLIRTECGEYAGTEIDVRKSFELKHNTLPIFERYFDGSNSSIVDINEDTIEIPNHFFVSGEKLTYNYDGSGSEPIGIATTTIAGIGTTDKLPSTVYAVKFTNRADKDFKIKLSASVSDSLLVPPKVLDITSVGIGTSHRFTSTNQNTKLLVTLDNIIQSPIVATSTTTILVNNINLTDERITFSGITSFFGGDIIRIDDEIMKISAVGIGSTNIIQVKRSWLGTGIATHSQGSLVTKILGNYNIVDNRINFETAPKGLTPIGSTTNPPDSVDFTGVQSRYVFGGRAFIRSGIPGGSEETYSTNYIFDDLSPQFNGITSSFTLKVNSSNPIGFSTNNAIVLINDIFQIPENQNYDLVESSGTTQINFTGSGVSASYDINTASLPRGGVIVSVSSSEGFGYQPLISAGGTAIVSTSGTIQSISIGNSGSGYRVGIQTIVNVGVVTSSTGTPNIQFIGTASVSNGSIVSVAITNPGTGYTSTNPPIVVFDDPLSYWNIPLIYSSSSSGVGTNATVDLVVSQDSSVLSFEITNNGYGYLPGDILTIGVGGTVGIPTNSSNSFKEFQITVDQTFIDKFSSWSIGNLQLIDSIENLFDGVKKVFPIKIAGNQTTIRSKVGSSIEIKYNLLVFVNNILQIPDSSYIFEGGSRIAFTEAPKKGDTCSILFYKGTPGVDTIDVDILETVKVGDFLTINSDDFFLKEDPRLSLEIISTDVVRTNVYPGPGTTQNETLLRPVTLCKQTDDKIINGQEVSKDRVLYEPLIQPTTNIIQNVGTSSTVIFVESVKTFFDSGLEYSQDSITSLPQKKIIIVSQDNIVSAAATAVVSAAGTITSIIITDGGVGYSTTPLVTIENPVGLDTAQRATASCTLSGLGTVSSITITNPGTGYTSTNPPIVFVGPPSTKYEIIDRVSYSGDFGIISGIQTVSVGVASTGIVFDLFIPQNSYLRNTNLNVTAIGSTISGIQTGYYFVVYNSNVGKGVTSLNQSGSIVGVGSTFIDNIYQVASVSIGQTHVAGIGLTYVAKVTVSVQNYNGLSGLGYSSFYGEYSWGRISGLTRTNSKSFTYYNNGILGVSTSPIVQRYNPLRYQNYTT